MDRVYLNSQEGYSYPLLAGQSLSLNELIHNGAQIKWQWVYDVLGYYVLGTQTENGIAVQEYLRPIEYDYDEATTVFAKDENGAFADLESINGVEVSDFLLTLSKTDGYPGNILVNEKTPDGYYPVDVDGGGYGVYAYLCNYGEIEYATAFDTALGEEVANGSNKQYPMTLNISAENGLDQVTEVATLTGLQDAITAGTEGVIRLMDNIALDATLHIPTNQQIVLDLNGYTLSDETTTKTQAILVNEGASLTMYNGTMTGNNTSKGEAIRTVGARVLLSNMNVSGFFHGIYTADNTSDTGWDSVAHLVNCTMNLGDGAVYCGGNGNQSKALTQIIVEGCTIVSKGVAIRGNTSKWGTDVQVLRCDIKCDPDTGGFGVYQPQPNSTMTVYKSTISGYTGINIKGGSVRVIASTVDGLGAKQDPAPRENGTTNTGDGIYIEANYGNEIRLEISQNSLIRSVDSYSLQVYEPDAPNVSVKIYSGQFDEAQPDDYIADGSVQTGSVVTIMD